MSKPSFLLALHRYKIFTRVSPFYKSHNFQNALVKFQCYYKSLAYAKIANNGYNKLAIAIAADK